MKTKLTFTVVLFFLSVMMHTISPSFGGVGEAQNIGINGTGASAHASALLDVDAVASPSLGILIPRIQLQATNLAAPVTSPATSLLVFNTASVTTTPSVAVTPGYYYWDGAKWVRLQTTASTSQDWSLLGNPGTSAGTNFLGTTDAQDVVFKTNGVENMRVANTTNNIGIGTATPNPSAKLDITSTTQGFAMPKMTTAQRLLITGPVDGLEVYDISLGGTYRFSTINNKWDCANNPAGTVQYFANTTAPIGYLACAGQTVSTTQYPELFTAIGYTYGGSGVVFNVPDLRGEFVRGTDMGRGVDPARVLGTAQLATEYSGNVWVNPGGNGYVEYRYTEPSATAWPGGGASLSGADWTPQASGTVLFSVAISNQASGGAGGITGRPRNIALMPCIKY